jgi:hypothetical protein
MFSIPRNYTEILPSRTIKDVKIITLKSLNHALNKVYPYIIAFVWLVYLENSKDQ